jgi:transposase
MLALKALGWGAKRISRELGCSRNALQQYLRQGSWRPMDVAARAGVLQPHRQWLAERLRQHRGNANVVRQDLTRELSIRVSLRTVQRAVEPLRRELRAEAVATVRYETAPGQQLQIDFGSTAVRIGEAMRRIQLFVATLGYSRRCYVAELLHERQSEWLQGLEGAFRHFGDHRVRWKRERDRARQRSCERHWSLQGWFRLSGLGGWLMGAKSQHP